MKFEKFASMQAMKKHEKSEGKKKEAKEKKVGEKDVVGKKKKVIKHK